MAIRTTSNVPEAIRLVGLGAELIEQNRPDEAIEFLSDAQRLDPNYGGAHFGEAIARLKLGQFINGFRKFEYRYHAQARRPRLPGIASPCWRGEPIKGKRILLHHEEGIGDTIQFARYVPLVAALGADVTLYAPESFRTLLRASFGRIASVPDPAVATRGYDVHCPFMSLPIAFGTTLETVPARIPYLSTTESQRKPWPRKIRSGPRKKVGIVWGGSPTHGNDAARSIPAELICSLTETSDFDCYSLQHVLRPGDGDVLARSKIEHIGAQFMNLADTAAAVELLDLVIAVDTGVAHLAGALGKQVWILLPFNSDWRWMINRTDSPWYPTARLFRQPKRGDWQTVLERVRSELIGL
jgi:hypothetical protein